MKKKSLIVSLVLVGACGLIVLAQSGAPELASDRFVRAEYATVRFMEERTSIVWPDGTVQNVIDLAGSAKFPGTNEKYPKGSDFRMFWLTKAMNIAAQKGFKL